MSAAQGQELPDDRRFLIVVCSLGGAAVVILLAFLVYIYYRQKAEREEAIAKARETAQVVIVEVGRHLEQYEFDKAFCCIERAQTTMRSNAHSGHLSEVEAQLEEILETVQSAKDDYERKTAEGYVHFEGRFLPRTQRELILAERKEAQEARRLEEEREAEEARKIEFHLVGYFKNDAMRGFTYYVKNPTRKDIEKFCAEEKKTYIDRMSRKRLLLIAFFDNRSATPDVTGKWYLPDRCHKYMVAFYSYNPFNYSESLDFYRQLGKAGGR